MNFFLPSKNFVVSGFHFIPLSNGMKGCNGEVGSKGGVLEHEENEI